MINYYLRLGINPNITEEELYKELYDRINYYKNKLTGRHEELDLKMNNRIAVIKNFQNTIESYGGKKGYDRALNMSNNDIIEINNYTKKEKNKKKFKLMIGAILAVAVISGVGIHEASFATEKIPVDSGISYNDFKEEYDLSSKEIKGFGDGQAEVKMKKDELNALKNKILEHERAQKKVYYLFDYEVEYGDTISSLAQLFKTTPDKVNGGNPNIVVGSTITVKTNDKSVADNMQKEYDNNKKEMELDYIYMVQQGDTIYSISEKTGVPVSDILNFNGLNANSTLYEGPLKIPKIEKNIIK